MTLSSALGWLLAVFSAAVALAVILHRYEVRKGMIDDRGRPGVSDGVGGALGFVGGSAAFLLGVLMLTSMDHFHATTETVDTEAVSYAAAYESAAGLAVADRMRVQRDLVCLMRSVATNSWAATKSGTVTGAEVTRAWRARVGTDISGTEPMTTAQENSLAAVQSELLEAEKAGQLRLLAAGGELPLALWVLVYVSVFVLTLALTLLLRPYSVLAVTGLSGVLILSAAMVWVLTAFAEPFTEGDGVFIAPKSLNSVLARIEAAQPNVDWGPCGEPWR